jgi:predicted O-methyltransferase YrrM
LYNTIIDSPVGDVIEVGSATGGTTVIMICAAELVGKKVYSIDPYPVDLEDKATHYYAGIMSEYERKFEENILTGQWNNVIQYKSTLSDCREKLPKNPSIIFIDSCHELALVQSEVDIAYNILVPGGYLYVHDVVWPLGQLSKTPESSLSNIPKWINKYEFSETSQIMSMFKGRKK